MRTYTMKALAILLVLMSFDLLADVDLDPCGDPEFVRLTWLQSKGSDVSVGSTGSSAFSVPSRKGAANLTRGNLYTIRECDSTGCEDRAVWAPVMVCHFELTEEAIEEMHKGVLVEVDGEALVYSTNHAGWTLDEQIVVYNRSLVFKQLLEVGREVAPPMGKPPRINVRTGSLYQLNRFNVYTRYELERTGSFPDYVSTGYEELMSKRPQN